MVIRERKIRLADVIILLISILLLSISVIKACTASLTYDELFTYNFFGIKPYHEITGYGFLTANNHMLNSFLMRTLLYILPDNQLVLRLPNIFGLVLYLIFSWKLVSSFKNIWLSIGAFLILNLNLYLLDFFCLARGYGLSIALMMAALYYYSRFLKYRVLSWDKVNKRKQLLSLSIGIVCFGLAVMASFTLLNVFIIFLGLLLIITVYDVFMANRKFKERLRFELTKGGILIILGFFLLRYSLLVCLRLNAHGEFYLGGKDGFWSDTVGTISRAFFYGHAGEEYLQKIIIGIVGILTVWSSLIMFNYKKIDPDKLFLLSIFLILMGAAIGSIVQHYVFASPFSRDRTALFYIQLFFLNAVFLFNRIAYRQSLITFAMILAACFCVLNFAKNYSFNTYREWLDCSKYAMEYLDSINKNKPSHSVVIYTSSMTDQQLSYYTTHNQYNWVDKISVEGDKEGYKNGYFFGDENDIKTRHFPGFKLIKSFPKYNMFIYGP